jgi:hypothetical protein
MATTLVILRPKAEESPLLPREMASLLHESARLPRRRGRCFAAKRLSMTESGDF